LWSLWDGILGAKRVRGSVAWVNCVVYHPPWFANNGTSGVPRYGHYAVDAAQGGKIGLTNVINERGRGVILFSEL